MKNEIKQLFEQQLNDWELAKNNYKALEQVKVKTLDVNGYPYKVQFNPARITSSAAKVDPQSIQERKCFLCSENRPPEQKGLPFIERYTILINPYPVFPRHLTIPALEHTPQLIASRFGDMLDLAQQLADYVVFYNGPKCGASAPDHFHFQAGNKGFLPIENERNWENTIRIESENKQEMLDRFQQIYDTLPLQPDDAEPMLNILTWYENGKWITCLFPRKKHRPACYSAEGDANLLISPASVDMGGVFITPLEKDFEKITAEDIAGILDEVNLKKDSQGATVRLNTDRKVIHLIFSADEAFEGASSILRTLDKNHAKASFFLTGNCLREKKFKSIIQKIIRKGHYVGGHSDKHLLYASWDDRQQSLVTPDSLRADFRQNMVELEKYGVNISQVHYFLPPYEYYNKESVRLIESLGQTVINYTPGLRTAADYTTPDMPNYKSSQELTNQLYAYEAEKGLNGSIILIHPGTQDIRTDKLYLRLDEIIRYLKAKGYAFERL